MCKIGISFNIMKKISSRKFVFCNYYNRDIPDDQGGCCDFYNAEEKTCEHDKYSISSRDELLRRSRLSERDDIFSDFNEFDGE